MMQATATAEQRWTEVKCPCRQTVLADVRGSGGETRRRCPKCRNWFVIDVASGRVRLDETMYCRASA